MRRRVLGWAQGTHAVHPPHAAVQGWRREGRDRRHRCPTSGCTGVSQGCCSPGGWHSREERGVSTAPTQYRQRGGKEKRKDGNIALLIALTASSTVNGCVITSPKQGRCRRCCSPLDSPGLRSCTHVPEQLGDICVTRDPGAAPPCARGHLAHEPTAKPRWINHTNDHTEPSTSSLAQTVCHTSKQKECYC